MAATIPTPPETPEPTSREVGTFVSTIPVGYLEPSSEAAQQIRAHLTTLTAAIPRTMLKDLLVLKLLAPDASQDLVVYNLPMAAQFLSQLRQQLVLMYYQEGGKR